VETPEPDAPTGETFAQALAALKDDYRISENKIAERIGVHVSTVNNWAHGKANPRPAAIRSLAQAFPRFTEARLFAAVGKRAPAPLPPDRRDAVLQVFDRLTEEQQNMLLIQASAVADSNDQSG
jgi:transcriptional regulator with XRE-family HTH domain